MRHHRPVTSNVIKRSALLGVCLLASSWLLLDSEPQLDDPSEQVRTPDATPQSDEPVLALSTNAVTPARPAAPIGVRKVDPDRVRAALARFNRALDAITKEDIEREQASMRVAEKHMRNVPLQEPRAEDFLDEHGLRWTKLLYPSGEVRYELPE